MSREEWININLESTIEFRNGKSSPLRNENGLNPVFGGNGIIGFTDEFNSDIETVIVGRVGAYCGSVYYHKGKCWVTDNAIIGKVREQCDGLFLYYLFKSIGLNDHRTGSSQPLVNQSILNSIKVRLPKDKQTQTRIASILSALDDKIELNRQTNATLEAITQAIFKEWFVNFKFPGATGEMVESELGMIPRRWKVGKLGEICEFAYGKGLKSENRSEGEYPVVGSNGIVGTHNEYLVEGPGIVIGRKGTIGEVAWIHKNFFPIDTTFYIRDILGVEGLYFHYFLLKEQDFKKIASDSAVPGLNRNQAYDNLIVIPTQDVIKRFNEITFAIFENIVNDEQQSDALAALRDTLLPKLMSGEIEV